VQRYALELTKAIDPELIDDQSTEYGFLLHDVGKIGIPDGILLKPGPLTDAERRRMQTHTILGEQMLGGVAFFQGEGLRVVRSHHERWDGTGYPDGIAGTEIPLGARIFAVADALDAMTSDRPYRKAMSWAAAGREILAESKRQFDPEVVESFVARERSLRAIRREFAVDSHDRRGALSGAVAFALPAVTQDERRGRRVALGLDRDDRPRAGQGGVPGDGLGLGIETDGRARLDDLGAWGEELRRALVVPIVELLAPGPDDALG